MTNENVVIDAEYSEVESTDVDIVQVLTVLPENTTALDVFKNENSEAEIILNRVKEHFGSLAFDMTTPKGRAECRSQAALIRKIKVRMEERGKAEADALKLLPKKIDNTRKLFKAELDQLADEVRAPLTAYEEEEERKKAEEKAKKDAEELAKQIEACHEEALTMNELFDLKREQEKQKAEQEAKEREEQLKRDAEAKAKADAEYQSQLAIQQAKNAELEAIRAKEQAEKEKAEALAKAEADKQAEIARINAENEAKEKARLDAEAKEKAEEEARKADREHQAAINRAVIAGLEKQGLDYDTALKILKAIIRNEITHVTINY